MSFSTQHNIQVPEFPILTVGVPVTLQMSILSNITDPVIVTPYLDSVVFLPETFVFTSVKSTVSFQVVGLYTYGVLSDKNTNPVKTGTHDLVNPGHSYFNLYWRYMYQQAGDDLPYVHPAYTYINVLPAGFIVSFPHLQIGQTSTLTISTTAPPRSDVVLTLIGNNLNFNPPNLLFTKSSTVATTQVSPVHADYKDFSSLPFTVDYILSGTNQADFIAPAQSFLAVSRGTAPQADSLQLAAASPAAYASLFVLVASLFALMM